MFIWDFVANPVMESILDWFYSQMVGFLGAFFAQMGNMGVELFDLSWVRSVVRFFSQLGWALFAVSVVVSAFECGIEYASGRGNLQQPALNALKGFFAVSLFTTVPVRLYALSVSLQGTFAMEITGAGKSIGELGNEILTGLEGAGLTDIAAQAKCVYQQDGYCRLERASSCGVPCAESPCVNFVPRRNCGTTAMPTKARPAPHGCCGPE